MPPTTSKGNTTDAEKRIKFAINLYDIDHINPFIRGIMLKGKVNTETPIRVDKNKPDETAVEFTCDLLTAALTIDVLRNEQRKVNSPSIRAYIYKKTWRRIPYNQVLTVIDEGKTKLAPDVFIEREEVELGEPEPLSAERI